MKLCCASSGFGSRPTVEKGRDPCPSARRSLRLNKEQRRGREGRAGRSSNTGPPALEGPSSLAHNGWGLNTAYVRRRDTAAAQTPGGKETKTRVRLGIPRSVSLPQPPPPTPPTSSRKMNSASVDDFPPPSAAQPCSPQTPFCNGGGSHQRKRE
ncbi:hypothetical protein JZ751_030015 [Albula glossodonta]|uniref:Uncharacterized protein n=1 Tax=Albula glossodonta TaxID=121402 RepID=A0A8T2MMQ8_9TELE|nr:hypothetical protein JZ751_030015 [Albula glossodonta]